MHYLLLLSSTLFIRTHWCIGRLPPDPNMLEAKAEDEQDGNAEDEQDASSDDVKYREDELMYEPVPEPIPEPKKDPEPKLMYDPEAPPPKKPKKEEIEGGTQS